jgi:hypothetical protein
MEDGRVYPGQMGEYNVRRDVESGERAVRAGQGSDWPCSQGCIGTLVYLFLLDDVSDRSGSDCFARRRHSWMVR